MSDDPAPERVVPQDEQPHVDRVKVDPLSAAPPTLIERLHPDSPKIGKQEREGSATYVELSEPHLMADCPFAVPQDDERVDARPTGG